MCGRLHAIDAASHQVDQPARAVELRRQSPDVRASQTTCRQGPEILGRCRDRTTTAYPELARCVASEMPKNPLPPAMTIGLD